ncbi:hypothetical protein F0562_033935 [Nyssa sinensis]|uniref:Retrovirus-related Pol polyprotein from transposon TNT 1-94-like beta-barrel domain-containing protein n=1 Tax=Nyssa sinensis TaxID=561372 RepID=A0A5J5AHN4_9ASTE|nr:hypothetical protein F0562_033935 [Nyssa sinensis]
MDPLPNVSRAYALVMQDERHRSISSQPSLEGIALAASNYPPQKDNRSGPPKKPLKCTHCGKDGHTIDRCYRIHGYPPGPRNPKPEHGSKHSAHQASGSIPPAPSSLPFTPEQCQQLLAILNNTSQPPSMAHHVGNIESHLSGNPSTTDPLWILDSGATDHMVCTPAALTHSTPVHGCTVQLPNGSYATVTHVGSIVFSPDLILKRPTLDEDDWTGN